MAPADPAVVQSRWAMAPKATKRNKILVVDDDPFIQSLVAVTLSGKYELSAASNGREALQALERECPDLVLCDVVMPQMDGLECLQRMTDLHPGLRVVMMTGETSPDTAITSLRHQAFDFLAKPFTVDQLREMVSEALDYAGPEEFRVLSAVPHWVEVEAPCSLASARRLSRFLYQLKAGLSPEIQDEVAMAFRELLQNAVEHGGKNDPNRTVRICYLRLENVIIYRIQDPGEGFRLEEIEHAAVANPPDDPLRHVRVREQMKLRAGGFGLFMTRQLVDEITYNEKRNEVVFVKYLRTQSPETQSKE